MNVSLGGQGQYGQEANFNMQGGYDANNDQIPTTSQGLKQFILKRPYTETIDG